MGIDIEYENDPYKQKVELLYNELDLQDIRESVQNMVFALNSNSRAGAEPSFSNLTLDFKVLKPMQDIPIILAGKEIDNLTYKDFQLEADILTDIFSDVMLIGDGNGNALSYPIPTFNIGKNMNWDNLLYNKVWEMSAKYGIPYFGNFIHGNLKEDDIYSMCPMTPDTEVLIRSNQNGVRISTISDIVSNMESKGTKYDVWTPEGWSDASPVKTPKTKVFELKLSNGTSVKFGENHLQPTMDNGTIRAIDLKEGMWLPFNKKAYDTKIGNFDMGYIVGTYIGDGSKDENRIVYSLDSAEKDDLTIQNLRDIWERKLGFKTTITYSEKNVRFFCINGNPYDIIKTYVTGDNALEKDITKKVFNSSLAFKEGLLSGFRDTDGARDRKRLYTSSEKLRMSMQKLLSSMGRKALINYKDDREDRFGENTNYRIDYPERENYGELYKGDNDYNYYKIESIEEINYTGKNLYCFEVDNEEHLFMIANGLITHNCRLRLDRRELINKTGGLFGAGEKTGSLGVWTINLPNIAFRSKGKSKSVFFNDLLEQMEIGKKQLILKKQFIQDLFDRGLYPALKKYLVSLDTLFLTIGMIGANEMCLNYLDKGIETQEGKDFTMEVLSFMRDKLSDFQEETGELFNLEATPKLLGICGELINMRCA